MKGKITERIRNEYNDLMWDVYGGEKTIDKNNYCESDGVTYTLRDLVAEIDF